jgi:hypothetical protein
VVAHCRVCLKAAVPPTRRNRVNSPSYRSASGYPSLHLPFEGFMAGGEVVLG